jgi:hypothetical protein
LPEESQVAADKAAKEKKAKEELEKEKERVIKEYQEKKKKREEKKKKKDKSKDEDKDKDKDEKTEKEEEAEKEKKVKEIESKAEQAEEEAGPQLFALNRTFFSQRESAIIAKERAKQEAAKAKKTQEFIRTPGAFPAVPSGDPSKSKP